MSVRGDGGLDYAWRVSQFGEATGALYDPLIQASVFPGESPAGPGWIVRTRVPVTGDLTSRARWCNEQNTMLFSADNETDQLLVPGGWGLSPDGECCLTSWLPPFPESSEHGRVAYLRRVAADHQIAVQSALAPTESAGVATSPATHAELPRWEFPLQQVGSVVGRLSDAGVIEWPEGTGHALFPAGQGQGRLRVEPLPSPRLHGAIPIRIFGELDGLTLAHTSRRARDIDVLGTWRRHEHGVHYEVLVPPAGLFWNSDRAIHELLTWIIRQLQSAAEGR